MSMSATLPNGIALVSNGQTITAYKRRRWLPRRLNAAWKNIGGQRMNGPAPQFASTYHVPMKG